METSKKVKNKFLKKIFQPFLAGLLALFPLAITLIIIIWALKFLYGYLGPTSNFGIMLQSIGLNFVASNIIAYLIGLSALLILIYLIGLFVSTRLKTHAKKITESLLKRIPIVGTLYNAAQKLINLFEGKDPSEMKAMNPVMCYFGGEGGTAVLALLTCKDPIRISGHDYYSVMIPSAPVPVGGAILYIPVDWVKPVDFGIDGLVNVYVSMGVSSSDFLGDKSAKTDNENPTQ
jgi:uncharacterized membrane protein